MTKSKTAEDMAWSFGPLAECTVHYGLGSKHHPEYMVEVAIWQLIRS